MENKRGNIVPYTTEGITKAFEGLRESFKTDSFWYRYHDIDSVEQWNLAHPEDKIYTNYLGIDGQYIHERWVAYPTAALNDKDVIVDAEGNSLLYVQEAKSFVIWDTVKTHFITNPFVKWNKLTG